MEYLGKLLTQKACFRISWYALGCLWECSWQALGAPQTAVFEVQKGSEMAPKLLQNATPRGPGALLGASWPSSPLFCSYVCLQGASWRALGRLRGRSKVLLSGPWALQDGSQDSFQRSWEPKGSQNGAREGPKSGPGCDSNQKRDIFKTYCFSIDFNDV